jgi:hypothetical protein
MDAMTTLVDAVLKYALGLAYTFRIAYMEGEKIFSFCKWKANLASGSKGDFHRHNCVNFFHPHVNHIIAKSGVESGQLGGNQIQGDVDVLETPCGDGIWHIESCPLKMQV